MKLLQIWESFIQKYPYSSPCFAAKAMYVSDHTGISNHHGFLLNWEKHIKMDYMKDTVLDRKVLDEYKE